MNYPKIFRLKPWNLMVSCTDVSDIRKEAVDVPQTLDALVQRMHYFRGVLRQLFRLGLILNCAQFAEFVEQVEKIFVFFE